MERLYINPFGHEDSPANSSDLFERRVCVNRDIDNPNQAFKNKGVVVDINHYKCRCTGCGDVSTILKSTWEWCRKSDRTSVVCIKCRASDTLVIIQEV